MPPANVFAKTLEESPLNGKDPVSGFLDDEWSEYVPGRNPHHHRFTSEELHRRILVYCLYMGAWLALVGVLAVLAVIRRQYGTLQSAREQYRKMKKREVIKSFSKSGPYSPLSTESSDEEDDLERGKQGRRGWCCGRSQTEPDIDEEPPVIYNGVVSEKDKLLDKAKLLKLKQQNEEEEEEEAEEAEKEEKVQYSKMSKAEQARIKQEKWEKVQKEKRPVGEELTHVLELQREEVKHESVPILQWVKMPISLLLFACYIVICLTVPLWAHAKNSCSQGLPWEMHMPFFHFFVVVKLWEVCLLAFDESIPGKISLFAFGVKFGSSFLAFFDGYSDANAILVAHDCGSPLWHWMAVCYVCGVVCAQWIFMGSLSLCMDTSKTCFFKMLHMDSLAECSSMNPGDKSALLAWRLVNVFRFLLEDLPQSLLQTFFVLTVKYNPVVICSIVVGVLTSAKAIYDASKRAAAALGTNFDYLVAVHKMQKCLDEEDEQGFNAAYDEAEAASSGGNTELLFTKLEAAERKFGVKAAQPVALVGTASDDNPPPNIVRAANAAPAQDSYVRRRRTADFALHASRRRERARRALEGPKSWAVQAGAHDEGTHSWREYVVRRRTVDFAKAAQKEREKQWQKMVKEGPGVCNGSRPKKPNEVADARWSG